MNQSPDNSALAVETLLRRIPGVWAPTGPLDAGQERALFLLVAAGLVERRFTIRCEIAGQPGTFEAAMTATGECGLMDAVDPLITELWARWADHFKTWKQGEAGHVSPFRVTPVGPDEWRLSARGLIERGKLGVDPGVGSPGRQAVLDFVLRTGRHTHRAPVLGEGRLLVLRREPGVGATDHGSPAIPTPVRVANPEEIASSIRQDVLPELLAVFRGGAAAKAGGQPQAQVECPHADDFTWVIWFGTKYTFSKGNQAQTLRCLWEQWENSDRCDGCGLGDEAIAEKIGAADNFRVKTALRGHPALGVMVCEVGKGIHALFRKAPEKAMPVPPGERPGPDGMKGPKPKKK